MIAIALLILFLMLFTIGTPLFVVIGLTTALGVFFTGEPVEEMAKQMFALTDKYELLAVPFFILAGVIMTGGGISRRLIDFARAAVGWMPGGLAIAAVASCMFFAAISGSSPATVVAIGLIMFPALLDEDYPETFSLGVVTSAGSLGILIPPSIPMIIYAIIIDGVSVSRLFIAGIIPGLLIGSLMVGYSIATGLIYKIPRRNFSVKELGTTFYKGFWSLMLPVLILGGIYAGIFEVVEAAAVAVVYALFVELFIHREISFKKLPGLFSQTAVEMGAILLIIAIAISLSWLLTLKGVPQALADYIRAVVDSRWVFLAVVNVLLLGVGCLMDIISALLIFAPLLWQIAETFGIDPIHLGIIFIVNLEIGYLTPPLGLNLFVSSAIFDRPLFGVVRGVVPFMGLMLCALMLITYIPEISLGLLGDSDPTGEAIEAFEKANPDAGAQDFDTYDLEDSPDGGGQAATNAVTSDTGDDVAMPDAQTAASP